jgi:putative transposase
VVQRHMGIAGVAPGLNLSKRNQAHAVYPYLLRHVTDDNLPTGVSALHVADGIGNLAE